MSVYVLCKASSCQKRKLEL
uniref:Uncharacterized protein n=1 Tax=Rhizophora mucronata TaxID=61149 RepID=A0A2P2QN85_RHIMU